MSLGDLYRRGASVRVGDTLGVAAITPGRFRQDMDRTNAYIAALAREVNARASTLSPAWKASWSDFVTQWNAFVADHPDSWLSDLVSSASTLLGGAWDRIMAFAAEARTWRASFDAGDTAAPDISPHGPSPWSLSPPSETSWFVWGLLGAGAIVAILYVRKGLTA